LVHWPLVGRLLLHLVQQGGDWAGPQHSQALHCTKFNSPPINGQCTNHRIAVGVWALVNNVMPWRCGGMHCIIKVRSHHAAHTPITLAVSSMADRFQAGRPGLQMSSWPGTVIPRWRTSSPSRVGVSKAFSFRFVARTVCSPYPILNLYGDWAFPVAAVWIWNSLPQHITSAPSLPVFCFRLKTHFFELCYL